MCLFLDTLVMDGANDLAGMEEGVVENQLLVLVLARDVARHGVVAVHAGVVLQGEGDGIVGEKSGNLADDGARITSLALKDVRQLETIKLLRKLSVPIEEIRLLQKGTRSFSESMNTQIELLEKQQQSAELMKDFCIKLKNEIDDFKQLDAQKYLSEIRNLVISK